MLGSVSAPFADFTWRHARSVLAARGADDTDERAIAAAVENLLTRAQNGEGWAAFVAEAVTPPEALAPSVVQRLGEDERAAHERAREDHHAQLVIVSTPTIRHVTATGRKRILLNRHQYSARRGLIVSGPAGTGKTTAITQLGKNYEQLARRRGELELQSLPVAYVTVPPAASPKMLAVELARFIGLPLPSRFSQVGSPTGSAIYSAASAAAWC
ncbi:ATP-binding protein [Streptomyces sp. NPDC029006]|uniref:ATP-binding protein n=1 Tax=Streptomyces sp. NPDC029006 TaxID=3155467 RepID=UPI0033C60DF7